MKKRSGGASRRLPCALLRFPMWTPPPHTCTPPRVGDALLIIRRRLRCTPRTPGARVACGRAGRLTRAAPAPLVYCISMPSPAPDAFHLPPQREAGPPILGLGRPKPRVLVPAGRQELFRPIGTLVDLHEGMEV